jgi:hypothetical protein
MLQHIWGELLLQKCHRVSDCTRSVLVRKPYAVVVLEKPCRRGTVAEILISQKWCNFHTQSIGDSSAKFRSISHWRSWACPRT